MQNGRERLKAGAGRRSKRLRLAVLITVLEPWHVNGSALPGAFGLDPSRRASVRGHLFGRPCLLAYRGPRARRRFWLRIEGGYPGPIEVRASPCAAEGVLTGDLGFDGRVRLFGEVARARAFATKKRREATVELFESGLCALRVTRLSTTVVAPGTWSEAEARAARRPLEVLLSEAEGPRAEAAGEERRVESDLLEVALEDPEVRVRAGAAEVLLARMRAGDEAQVSAVSEALFRSSAVRARQRLDALWTIEAYAPDAAPNVLRKLLDVEDPALRAAVIERIGERRMTKSAGAVARLCHASDERVAKEAVRALGLLDVPELEPVLLERLFSGEPSIRAAAATALGVSGRGPGVARALRRVATERGEQREVRAAAKRALQALETRLPLPGALALHSVGPSRGGLSPPEEEPDDLASSSPRGQLFDGWL